MAVVEALVLAVKAGGDFALGRRVGGRLVGDDALRRAAGGLQRAPQRPLRRRLVPAWLKEFLKDHAALVRGPPQPQAPAADRDLGLVEVPDVSEARASPCRSPCAIRGRTWPPTAAASRARPRTPLEERLLAGAQAQREAQAQLDRVGDERGREAVAPVEGGGLAHCPLLPAPGPSREKGPGYRGSSVDGSAQTAVLVGVVAVPGTHQCSPRGPSSCRTGCGGVASGPEGVPSLARSALSAR